MAASPSLLTPIATSKPRGLPLRPILTPTPAAPPTAKPRSTTAAMMAAGRRRELALSLAAGVLTSTTAWLLAAPPPASASSEDEEYVRDTSEVINKVRSTITMDRSDPNVASAVAELREASNFWVAKYRREKGLLGRASFRDMYSALNAVSGHYISFGPTAPIPAKRKTRILEEMETAEKALLRGR